MRKARVYIHNQLAGKLKELQEGIYIFEYDLGYSGEAISLTMPVDRTKFEFDSFPPFFDGLLPEGIQLDGLLKKHKIDKQDYFKQLVLTGQDLVGAVTIGELETSDE